MFKSSGLFFKGIIVTEILINQEKAHPTSSRRELKEEP